MTEFTEFFKPITARCPACGFFGEPKEINFTISPGEKTLFRFRCANCGNSWKASGGNMSNEPFLYAAAPFTCEEVGQAGAVIANAFANAMNTPYITGSEKEEKPAMKATYNGFTGELVKLERLSISQSMSAVNVISGSTINQKISRLYNLSIYDSENHVTHSFTNVKLEDVKFSGGVMTFGG